MRTFVPVEPFTRVEFACAHGLVVVESDGLAVDTEDGDGEPINGDLLSALAEHEQVSEVGVEQHPDEDAPDEDAAPDEEQNEQPDEPDEQTEE